MLQFQPHLFCAFLEKRHLGCALWRHLQFLNIWRLKGLTAFLHVLNKNENIINAGYWSQKLIPSKKNQSVLIAKISFQKTQKIINPQKILCHMVIQKLHEPGQGSQWLSQPGHLSYCFLILCPSKKKVWAKFVAGSHWPRQKTNGPFNESLIIVIAVKTKNNNHTFKLQYHSKVSWQSLASRFSRRETRFSKLSRIESRGSSLEFRWSRIEDRVLNFESRKRSL